MARVANVPDSSMVRKTLMIVDTVPGKKRHIDDPRSLPQIVLLLTVGVSVCILVCEG